MRFGGGENSCRKQLTIGTDSVITGQWVNDNRVFRVAQLDGDRETWLEAASEADAIEKAEREFREADASCGEPVDDDA